jgi:predicted RNA methylase
MTELSFKISYLLGNNNYAYPSDEYLKYITPSEVFNIVLTNANLHFNLKYKIVWDMFAGIGTDSIRLASSAGLVYSTELNKDTFECLILNISRAKINGKKSNIEAFNDDCCRNIMSNADIIYFDPPWGETFKSGVNFSFDNVLLSNGKSVMSLMKDLYKKYDLIVKVPYLCDNFESIINEEDIICILTFSRQ